MKTHNLVYKITNNRNGKYYIGIHSTNDINDGYMGSGTLLKRIQLKEGIGNFTKMILFDYRKRKTALKKERELVGSAQVRDSKCYNLTVGGGSPLTSTKSQIKPKFARYNERYQYIFTSRKGGLDNYQRQINALPNTFYKLISQTFIDNHDNLCELLTDFYNNRYKHQEAQSLIDMYEEKNLAYNFVITTKTWEHQ